MNEFLILRPIAVTDDMLTSSSVSEADESEYSSSTTYAKEDRCMITTAGVHKVYESQQASNTDNYPPDNLVDDEDGTLAPWKLISSTNRWKMFDPTSRAATTDSDEISVVLEPGTYVPHIALLGLDCEHVSITMVDPTDGEVYAETVNLVDLTGIIGYFNWFFTPAPRKYNFLFSDLPYYPDATITLIFSDPGATVTVGEIIPGVVRVKGTLESDNTFSTEDSPDMSSDGDGNTTLESTTYVSVHDYKVKIDVYKVAQVKRELFDYRSTPMVYVHPDYLETLIYGFALRSQVNSNEGDFATMNLEVQEFV